MQFVEKLKGYESVATWQQSKLHPVHVSWFDTVSINKNEGKTQKVSYGFGT